MLFWTSKSFSRSAISLPPSSHSAFYYHLFCLLTSHFSLTCSTEWNNCKECHFTLWGMFSSRSGSLAFACYIPFFPFCCLSIFLPIPHCNHVFIITLLFSHNLCMLKYPENLYALTHEWETPWLSSHHTCDVVRFENEVVCILSTLL